jgi:hypothetical protein
VIGRASNLTAALGLNRQVLLDGCRRVRLALFKNILDVQADVLLCGLE